MRIYVKTFSLVCPIVALLLSVFAECDPGRLTCRDPKNANQKKETNFKTVEVTAADTNLEVELYKKTKLMTRQINNIINKMNSTRYIPSTLIQKYRRKLTAPPFFDKINISGILGNMTVIRKQFQKFYIYLTMMKKREMLLSKKHEKITTYEKEMQHFMKSIQYIFCVQSQHYPGKPSTFALQLHRRRIRASKLNKRRIRSLKKNYTKYNAQAVAILQLVRMFVGQFT